jgi:hypothetical protein
VACKALQRRRGGPWRGGATPQDVAGIGEVVTNLCGVVLSVVSIVDDNLIAISCVISIDLIKVFT